MIGGNLAGMLAVEEDGVIVSIDADFINEGRFVRIIYTVENTNSASRRINLGARADSQVGNDASREVMAVRLESNRGVAIREPIGNMQFNFFGRNAPGITTPIDNLWIGSFFSDEWLHNTMIFTNNTVQNYQGTGAQGASFAFSWTDRTIGAGETAIFSVIIGMGEVAEIPVVTRINNTVESFESTDVVVRALVSDNNQNPEVSIFYSLNGGAEQQLPGRITDLDTAKEFEIDLSSYNLPSGNHTIQIWALNRQGNPSEFIEIPFVISNLRRPTIVMSEEWTRGEVSFRITDEHNDPQDVLRYEVRLGDGNWETIGLNTDRVALNTTGTMLVSARAIGVIEGEVSGIVSRNARVDLDVPEIEFAIDGLTLEIIATDEHSGVSKIEYGWLGVSDSLPSTWIEYTGPIGSLLMPGEGRYLHVRVVDNVGNETLIVQGFRIGRKLTSEVYDIDDEYVRKITPNTTVANFLENVDLVSQYELRKHDGGPVVVDLTLYNKNDEAITGVALVGTGMILSVDGKDYILVVMGDFDGDGRITPTDLSILRRHMAGLETLTSVYRKAGELTTNGQITLTDLLRVRRHLSEIEFIGG